MSTSRQYQMKALSQDSSSLGNMQSNHLPTRVAARLISTQEECGELVQAVSKVLRFGLNDSHPDNPDVTNRSRLVAKAGDVFAMIDTLIDVGVFTVDELDVAASAKKAKLKKRL